MSFYNLVEKISAILGDNDNPSDKANAFLYRNEDVWRPILIAVFSVKSIKNIKPLLTTKKHYKLALLEQALYVLKNGDISVDSGYDQEQGIVARNLKSLVIAPNCKKAFNALWFMVYTHSQRWWKRIFKWLATLIFTPQGESIT